MFVRFSNGWRRSSVSKPGDNGDAPDAAAFATIHFLERAILLGRIPPETSQWKLKYVAREIIRDQCYNRMGSMLWLKGPWNQKGSIFSRISNS